MKAAARVDSAIVKTNTANRIEKGRLAKLSVKFRQTFS